MKKEPKVSKKKAAEIQDAIQRGQVGAPQPEQPETDASKKLKLRQAELANMPKPDKVGKAAEHFRDAVREADDAHEAKGEAADNLIRAMKSAKRYTLQIDGYKFELHHTGAKDTIKIIKPK